MTKDSSKFVIAIIALTQAVLLADGLVLTTHTEDVLQRLMDSLDRACDLFTIKISVNKTEVMDQGTDIPVPPVIQLNGSSLNAVDKFAYLGLHLAVPVS